MTLIPNRQKQSAAAFGVRLLVWMFTLFAVVETPLGTGDLYGTGPSLAKGIAKNELPARFANLSENRHEQAAQSADRELIRSAILEHPLEDAALPPVASALPTEQPGPPAQARPRESPAGTTLDGYDAQAPPRA